MSYGTMVSFDYCNDEYNLIIIIYLKSLGDKAVS